MTVARDMPCRFVAPRYWRVCLRVLLIPRLAEEAFWRLCFRWQLGGPAPTWTPAERAALDARARLVHIQRH